MHEIPLLSRHAMLMASGMHTVYQDIIGTSCAGAAEFKKEYETAVLHNEKLLGLSEADGASPADVTKADDEADELAEGVSNVGISDKKPGADQKAAEGA